MSTSGKDLRRNGPIGRAPASGGSASPASYPGTANTIAKEFAGHQSGDNKQTKDMGGYTGGMATPDKSGGAMG